MRYFLYSFVVFNNGLAQHGAESWLGQSIPSLSEIKQELLDKYGYSTVAILSISEFRDSDDYRKFFEYK